MEVNHVDSRPALPQPEPTRVQFEPCAIESDLCQNLVLLLYWRLLPGISLPFRCNLQHVLKQQHLWRTFPYILHNSLLATSRFGFWVVEGLTVDVQRTEVFTRVSCASAGRRRCRASGDQYPSLEIKFGRNHGFDYLWFLSCVAVGPVVQAIDCGDGSRKPAIMISTSNEKVLTVA